MGRSLSVMPASQAQRITKAPPRATLRLPLFTIAQRFFIRVHPLWLHVQRLFRKQGISYSEHGRDSYHPLNLEKTILAFMSMFIQMAQVRLCILSEGQWKQLANLLIECMKERGHIQEQDGQLQLVNATINIIDLEQLVIDKFQQIIAILGWHAQVTEPVSFLVGLQLPDAMTAEQQVLSARSQSALFDRYLNVFKNFHMFSCWSQQPSKEEVKTVRAVLHIASYDIALVRTMFVMKYDMDDKRLLPGLRPFSDMLNYINSKVAPGQELLALSHKECNQLFAKLLGDYLVKYAAASWLFLAYCAHKGDVTVDQARSFLKAYQLQQKYLPGLCGCTLELDLEQCSLEAVHQQLQILGLIPQGRQPGLATIDCAVLGPMFEWLKPSLTDCATIHVKKAAFQGMFKPPSVFAVNGAALRGPRSRTCKTPPQSPTAHAASVQLPSLTPAHQR